MVSRAAAHHNATANSRSRQCPKRRACTQPQPVELPPWMPALPQRWRPAERRSLCRRSHWSPPCLLAACPDSRQPHRRARDAARLLRGQRSCSEGDTSTRDRRELAARTAPRWQDPLLSRALCSLPGGMMPRRTGRQTRTLRRQDPPAQPTARRRSRGGRGRRLARCCPSAGHGLLVPLRWPARPRRLSHACRAQWRRRKPSRRRQSHLSRGQPAGWHALRGPSLPRSTSTP
mmetsp:Transcript_14216/g.53850  ORF Transcript_14216/g.53850 Transcript_14216/m.53850 type:complete len:232 (-) Transcript_14216:1115-1810(-)